MPTSPDTPPRWISHRGDKRAATENTLAAFEAARAGGFTMLETDIRLTQDGHLILHHDTTLERLSGDTRRIDALSRQDLAALRLTDGSPLLFFDDFAERFADFDWVLDIKPEGALATLDALAEWAGQHGYADHLRERCIFLAWSRGHEAHIQKRFPGSDCFARQSECIRAGVFAALGVAAFGGIRPGRTYALIPRLGPLRLFQPSVVAHFHRRKARVLAFLPETEADTQAALDAGFDFILSDHPILAR